MTSDQLAVLRSLVDDGACLAKHLPIRCSLRWQDTAFAAMRLRDERLARMTPDGIWSATKRGRRALQAADAERRG